MEGKLKNPEFKKKMKRKYLHNCLIDNVMKKAVVSGRSINQVKKQTFMKHNVLQLYM